MMMPKPPLMEAFLLLARTATFFFCTLFFLRFVMQWRRVSFAGQLGAFVMKLTNWAVIPLRRVIPGWRGMDWASLFAFLFFQALYLGLRLGLEAFFFGAVLWSGFPVGVLLIFLQEVLCFFVYFAMGVILIYALLSWVNPYSPLASPLSQLANPILRPVRRFVPLIAGIDLSPLIVLLLLQILLIFLA